jgi:AAA+ ATPase superfamily predicted ATPase
MEIIARKKEKDELFKIYNSNRPEFIAIYGRRRIGKTYLIQNYFQDKGFFFYITGVPEGTTNEQLFNFNEEYIDVFPLAIERTVPKTWAEAFSRLRRQLTTINQNEKIVIFIDELPWIATHKSGFIAALSHLWNRYLSNNPSIKLIICGSAASWIIKHIVDAKGSLHNRLTKQIRLQPFDLTETEIYLREKKINLDRKQIIDIYMAIGGVAAYLNYIEPGKSSQQIISEVCLSHQNTSLYGEFNRLFKALFKNHHIHITIIKALSTVRSGMNRETLIAKTNITSASVLNKVLNELIESGFIAETNFFHNKSKNKVYRIIDEYSLFYLKWYNEIKNQRVESTGNYWLSLLNSRAYNSWAGFSFESICYNHINPIAHALGISGILYSYSTWSYNTIDNNDKGVQIDLIIDRPDNCINLCEIKYSNSKFTITKQYAKDLLYKKEKFIEKTKTKKTVFITMITPYGINQNIHSIATINNEITMNELFLTTHNRSVI